MPKAKVGEIELEYEVHGDSSRPTILLIMGLGAQLTRWPEAFYRALVAGGYRVVLFDNRDIGLSTKLENAGRPNLPRAIGKAISGGAIAAPYLLDDMAADTVGLLDALDIPKAHVVGASMGGMIGQILAAKYPERVSSFVSLMSTSGSRKLPKPRLSVQLRMIRTQLEGLFLKRSRDAVIRQITTHLLAIGSPGFPASPTGLRARVARDYDRSYSPHGFSRQLLAILASGSRTHLLGNIRARTLIVHGKQDPLVPVEAAHHLHELIVGSKLEVISGMGHDVPAPLIPKITQMILDHVAER